MAIKAKGKAQDVEKSKQRISYKEFSVGLERSKYSREFLAGFRMYLGETEYLTENEWNRTLENYQTRRK